MIGLTSAPDPLLIGLVLVSLLMFGIVYNQLVSWCGHRKEGYTSLLVVGGVLITLAGVALISWQAAGLSLIAFAASGLPMVIGEIIRYIRQRERALDLMRRQATGGDESGPA